MTVELGSSYSYQRKGTKTCLVDKKDSFQYVPLIENLHSLLENKEIFDEVLLRTILIMTCFASAILHK